MGIPPQIIIHVIFGFSMKSTIQLLGYPHDQGTATARARLRAPRPLGPRRSPSIFQDENAWRSWKKSMNIEGYHEIILCSSKTHMSLLYIYIYYPS